jgi:Predicted xylanase/chitin deacetylase
MKIMKSIAAITAVCVLLLIAYFPARAHETDIQPTDKLVYSSQKNSSKKIALTFDDGPHPRHTEIILDILKKYDIKATFFVVGRNAMIHSEIIKREIREGHEIGNHTYSHINLLKEQCNIAESDILLTENALYEICEYRPKLLRPPGGKYGETACLSAKKLDYRIVLWTIDSKDWSKPPAEKIAETILETTASGDILLFHDFIAGISPTPQALEIIIPELLKRGYNFVTVSELISSS